MITLTSPPNVSTERLSPRRDDETPRIGSYAIDHAFEGLLARANRAWAELEAELIADAPPPSHPFVVICYPPRSGSTFLAQLLARTRRLSYVSNFMARFWEAPYLAGLIERRLGLRSASFPHSIGSEYGVTHAPNEPHEFGFFWNRWLTFVEGTHRVDEDRMPDAQRVILRQELRAMMSLYDQPFFVKSDLVGLNVSFFHRLVETARFIVLKRDPRFVAQSIYQARRKLYGDERVFWSTRPSNAPSLQARPVPEQIAGQIRGIYDDIYAGLRTSGAPYIEVEYEALCRHPERELARLLDFADVPQIDCRLDLNGRVSSGNRRYLPPDLFESLCRAVEAHF